MACQDFLVREACVGVLVGEAGFLLSGVYACYYTRDEAARTPNFIVFDKDFKVVGKHLFGWTHGMDVVPGGFDGAVRFTNCVTLNNNWDLKSPVVPQVVVQFGDLKDGKLTDITKYIGYNKPMKR